MRVGIVRVFVTITYWYCLVARALRTTLRYNSYCTWCIGLSFRSSKIEDEEHFERLVSQVSMSELSTDCCITHYPFCTYYSSWPLVLSDYQHAGHSSSLDPLARTQLAPYLLDCTVLTNLVSSLAGECRFSGSLRHPRVNNSSPEFMRNASSATRVALEICVRTVSYRYCL